MFRTRGDYEVEPMDILEEGREDVYKRQFPYSVNDAFAVGALPEF